MSDALADFIASLDSLYETMPTLAGTYNGLPVTFLPKSIGGEVRRTPGVATADRVVRVRASEVAEPERGGVVVIGAATYVVAAPPTTSGPGIEWTLQLQRKAGA